MFETVAAHESAPANDAQLGSVRVRISFRGVAASGPERGVAVFAKVGRVTLCAPKNRRQRSAVPTVSSSAMSVPVDLLFRSPRISVD
jgi:hypothetical protein